ncbi:MAG TPA: efflux RND transporter permease subunit [Thermoanaerobaculia bacterium]|nr:efflux RND transporter permease subunit [Thermoanaerobaculia bacterium]
MNDRRGIAGALARAFLHSKLTPLLIVGAIALGFLSLAVTPREEEPQIRVPMVDVFAADPGAPPEEIARRVVEPIEKAMWGIAGVEHVYSTARTGSALVTVRFRVNEPNEASLVKVYERLGTVRSELPSEVPPPVVELKSIDDVPFLTLTISGPRQTPASLRVLADELAREIAEVENTTRVTVTGGPPRVVRVEPDPARLAAAGLTWADVSGALRAAQARLPAGDEITGDRILAVETGSLFRDGSDVARAVVGRRGPAPILLSDVARVVDGPDETTDYVFSAGRGSALEPAVTISVSKRPGTNATTLSRQVLAKLDALRPRLLPAGVRVAVTRDYGKTANEKANELVEHLLLATLSVTVLIALAMGWRSAAVVAIAVPVTLALTLFVYYLFGYTLNRVTLFALIFSIGILVDDAIVVVENIERHHRERPGEPLSVVAVHAVAEVGAPTILATFTVIAAILPMAFVRGLMGPYMRPIPAGASFAMLFSLAVAFIVSPWAALRIFKTAHRIPESPGAAEGRATRLYRRMMGTLIRDAGRRRIFFLGVAALLLLSVATVAFGLVRVKMLPFDNKSEFQVLIDQNEGTPLEETLETARRVGRALDAVPEIANYQIYAGAPAPFNFNGLVRHYFLRREPNRADVQVNLVPKGDRSAQSHAIAKRVRVLLDPIARGRRARVKVIEIPPGPPVLDTLVAEIYGPGERAREELAARIRGFFDTTPGVVDVDDSLEAPHDRIRLRVDAEKAASHAVAPGAAAETIAASGQGEIVGALDLPRRREPVPIRLQLSPEDRDSLSRRLGLRVASREGAQISLSELAKPEREPSPQPILHKDLRPVVYVFGDLAGQKESPVYALAALNGKIDALRLPGGQKVRRYSIRPPETSDFPALKWDGEWQITYEVFRDLGIAFAIVLVLITLLVVAWFQSFRTPIAILLPIPLSLIGILPGHLLFGAFFTATSMIGFIAGAGIIVRNSIILVDFIELKVRAGMPLEEAVVEAGAVRFRPMLLTAAAVVAGSAVILFDPIFQGLAISLMMGEVAATLLSRMTVPVLYYVLTRKRHAAGAAVAA